MCRRRSSLLLGKCCQLVAPGTSPIISAAQAVIMLYTCQPFYASTSILSSLLLCLHCLRSSPRLTLPSSSDSTGVCPYHPPRTGIFCPSKRQPRRATTQSRPRECVNFFAKPLAKFIRICQDLPRFAKIQKNMPRFAKTLARTGGFWVERF